MVASNQSSASTYVIAGDAVSATSRDRKRRDSCPREPRCGGLRLTLSTHRTPEKFFRQKGVEVMRGRNLSYYQSVHPKIPGRFSPESVFLPGNPPRRID